MPQLNLFLVEDSPIIRESLTATLEELAPVRVIGSAEGETDALRRLRDQRPEIDAVIVDVFLAEGSGYGVLRGLRDAQFECPRIVLTNYATEDVRRECMALGATQVFDKSAEIDALVDHCNAMATRLSS